jgi:putative ABC transport system permease protein
MAIPLTYNLRSVRQRWTSAVVAVLGIAGTVAVFVAMMAMAQGFRATLIASGSPRNAIVLRAGASTEMYSALALDQVKIVEDLAAVARGASGPLVSPEVVVVAAFPLRRTMTDANVQVRGVSPRVLEVRDSVKVTVGRFFTPGLSELVVGKNAAASYAGLDIGNRIKFGGGTWEVVGIFDAGGSAFDSEAWCDANVLNQTYQRPQNIFQSMTVRLAAPTGLTALKDGITTDPRLTLGAEGEQSYYSKQSESVTRLITILGTLVAVVMGIGAVFGALNTMYSAVAERKREIATMRALGFGGGSVIASFVVESLMIALVGGVLGCLVVLPINGLTTGTMNWQTFSHIAFAFRITPALLLAGVVFALLMGLVGGVPPAIRAVRRQVAPTLREL